MKTMAQIEYIKHLYENEGKSLREIAKIVDMSFRTVQKFAYQANWSSEKLPNMEPKAYPVLGPYMPIIDEWLEHDALEPRKQRHSMSQTYKRLKNEKQYTGSYDSVKKYVRKKKYLMKQMREGFLPLAQPQGHAQVDFGDFKYYDGLGSGREGHALVITFPHSNTGWMQVFPSENQECLLTGMKRIFKHIGGTPIKVKCDNMTTVVAQVLKGTERILSDGFIRFKLHYRFMAEFCNPASGHEKGNVENKVGYSRRNMLVPVPVIEDFDIFNKDLLRLCDENHNRPHYKHSTLISELWEQERRKLLTLPEHDYEVFRYESLSVKKYGFVTLDTNKYGLSPGLSGKIVQAKIYCNCVELYYDRSLLKTYERSYNKNNEVMDWKQYLPTLSQKPGAVPHTRFYDQLPKLWREHLKNTQCKERKTALMVLSEIISDGNEEFCDEALSLALECGRTDADSIRQCYYMVAKTENHPRPLVLSSSPPVITYIPNLTVYDSLIGTGGNSL